MVPSTHLDKIRFLVKIGEVLLSFVAFILEEVVNSCISCGSLYFFEFVSCTAFLFTLLLLILLSTRLHTKVGIDCWPKLDVIYTGGIAVLFLLSSIVFAADNSGTTPEKTAVAFGFLATVAFILDLILHIKSKGLPWTKDGKQESSNGGPAPAEQERLRTQE
ncbi:hypothetical protein Q8A73_007349 [Channa argus]|nr:hypothetical protein Q8A73_007349 [Channa argus]